MFNAALSLRISPGRSRGRQGEVPACECRDFGDARWDAIEPPAGRALQRSFQQDDKPADAARSGSLWLTALSPKVALLRIGKISIA